MVISCTFIAVGLVCACLLMIRYAQRELERLDVTIASVKTADNEIVGFAVAYLFPLITTSIDSLDHRVVMAVVIVFILMIWTTNSYHTNPLLGLAGYHFYEVVSNSGLSYLLISRRDIRSTSSVRKVVQLTEYMLLDPGPGR